MAHDRIDYSTMPSAERRLLERLLGESGEPFSRDELELALARLRNLREKYRERAKRQRVDARAGLAVESGTTLTSWLGAIERAEERARAVLACAQEPGPPDAADRDDTADDTD